LGLDNSALIVDTFVMEQSDALPGFMGIWPRLLGAFAAQLPVKPHEPVMFKQAIKARLPGLCSKDMPQPFLIVLIFVPWAQHTPFRIKKVTKT
jgi:hypothetical protein